MDQTKRQFVDEYREKTDPDMGKRYSVLMILQVIEYSSGAYYGPCKNREPLKRGPKTSMSDDELEIEIRKTMDDIPFHGTGYKKIHGRMSADLRGKMQKKWAKTGFFA